MSHHYCNKQHIHYVLFYQEQYMKTTSDDDAVRQSLQAQQDFEMDPNIYAQAEWQTHGYRRISI